jgi:branched-chain amino acid transport system permease protein
MSELATIAARGAGLGALFTLVAISINIIFNSSGVLNFAQGQYLVLGAFLSSSWQAAQPSWATPRWWLLLVAIVAIVVILSVIQGWLTLRPMRSENDQHSWIMTTLAASIILGAVIVLVTGPRTVTAQDAFGSVPVGGITLPLIYPILLLAALLIFAGLNLYKKRSLTGLTLNALSQDLHAAQTAGARTTRLQLISFGLGGGITGLAGYLGGPIMNISTESALHYVVYAFIVAVIGGVGNQLGALVAGPAFGLLLVFASFQVGGSAELPFALLIIVAVLMIRPQGLFGRHNARRV